MWAMRRAVMSLTVQPDYVLIDGNTSPKGMPCTAEKVVGGDALSLSIAAASIVAKVTRDRMCEIMHCEEPQFGFDSHKGYSAPPHFRALETHGPGRYHRMDFAPCIEADTRRKTGIMIGPLDSPGGGREPCRNRSWSCSRPNCARSRRSKARARRVRPRGESCRPSRSARRTGTTFQSLDRWG